METRANKHTLTIRNVQASDFGNYSCVAENSLGRAKKYMELSGMCVWIYSTPIEVRIVNSCIMIPFCISLTNICLIKTIKLFYLFINVYVIKELHNLYN